MSNIFAALKTPHHTVRIYVPFSHSSAIRFLQSICIWGDYDHEINRHLGFEIPEAVEEAATSILKTIWGMQSTPEMLY